MSKKTSEKSVTKSSKNTDKSIIPFSEKERKIVWLPIFITIIIVTTSIGMAFMELDLWDDQEFILWFILKILVFLLLLKIIISSTGYIFTYTRSERVYYTIGFAPFIFSIGICGFFLGAFICSIFESLFAAFGDEYVLVIPSASVNSGEIVVTNVCMFSNFILLCWSCWNSFAMIGFLRTTIGKIFSFFPIISSVLMFLLMFLFGGITVFVVFIFGCWSVLCMIGYIFTLVRYFQKYGKNGT